MLFNCYSVLLADEVWCSPSLYHVSHLECLIEDIPIILKTIPTSSRPELFHWLSCSAQMHLNGHAEPSCLYAAFVWAFSQELAGTSSFSEHAIAVALLQKKESSSSKTNQNILRL